MHAFLLINSDPTEFATKNNAKIIPFSLQKIEDARELKKFVKFKLNEKTAIVIKDIDSASIETANAFLKNLEEPTQNIIYVLTASNISNVLPTIISRCEIIQVKSEKLTVNNSEVEHFLNIKKSAQIEQTGKIKDRDEAINFVEKLLYYFHSELTRNPTLANTCETCLKTISALRMNGNVSLQLTNFVVKMGNEDNT